MSNKSKLCHCGPGSIDLAQGNAHPPADVKRKIEDALKRSAIEAQQINVSVRDGGHVALDGFVHDWRERAAAEHAAWSAPGVTGVEDRLTIF